MLIIAPKHPVMLVYDLDQTKGKELPREIDQFAKVEGRMRRGMVWWTSEISKERVGMPSSMIESVSTSKLCTTNSGFATVAQGDEKAKMRIAIHAELLINPARTALCATSWRIFCSAISVQMRIIGGQVV